MRLYDSDPSQYSDELIVCFEGLACQSSDPSIFVNFNDARNATIERLETALIDIQLKLDRVRKMDAYNCPVGENPFAVE